MKRVLITGAAGLVGGCLTQELLTKSEQCEVFCALRGADALARLDRKLQVAGLSCDAIRVYTVDLEDFTAVQDMINAIRPDVVFHTAAKVSLSDDMGEQMVRANLDMTHFLSESLLGAQHTDQSYKPLLVHVSSIAAFGVSDPRGMIDHETPFTNIAHASAYARSKFLSQNDVVRASKLGLRTIIVNPSVIIGINSGLGQMQNLFEMISRGMSLYTDGEMGYVDARDVAHAMIALSQVDEKITRNEIYCLNGSNLTFAEFITVFGAPFGCKAPKVRVGRTVLRVAQGLNSIWSKISGKKPLLTPAIVSYLTSKARYDGSKIESHVPNFRYQSIEETAQYIARNLDSKRS